MTSVNGRASVLARVVREPAALLGLVAAVTGLCILFGVPLTVEQAGGILTAVGALVAALRYVVVPAAEVVVQQRPDGEIVAGPASWVSTGHAVTVDVEPVPTDLPPPPRCPGPERGADRFQPPTADEMFGDAARPPTDSPDDTR